jgi:transposase-like protein
MEAKAACPPCPNEACGSPRVVRNGSLEGRQRYRCRGCGLWFGETYGTPLYRLKTPPEEIARALLVVMRRGSLRAAEEVTGHKYETIGRWLRLAARHASAIEEALVRDLELSTVEIDEFWSFVKRRTSVASRLTRRMSGIAGAA